MKKKILTMGTAMVLFIGGAALTGCENSKESTTEATEEAHEHGEGEEHEHMEGMEMEEGEAHEHAEGEEHGEMEKGEEMAHGHYQCPMKCEGEKMYEEAGECPKCNMDLALLKDDEVGEH